MKKITFKFLLVAYLIAIPSFIFSQDDVGNESKMKIGYQIGLNVSNIDSENDVNKEYYNVIPRFGFNVGFVLDTWTYKFITVQSGLLFTTKGNVYKDINNYTSSFTEYKNTFHTNLFYLELPINCLLNLNIKKGKFYLGGGPYFAYGVYGKVRHFITNRDDWNKYSHTEEEYIDLFKGDYKSYDPFDFGINLLGGYEFSSGLYIKAGYSKGLTNISNSVNGTNNKQYNNGFDLSMGYKIKL